MNKQFNDYEQFAVFAQLDQQIENIFEQMYVVSKDINQYLSDPTLGDFRGGNPAQRMLGLLKSKTLKDI